MASLKTLTMVAAFAGATSLAIAQSGSPTGGQPPVAGGAAASGQTGGGTAGAGTTMHTKSAKHKHKHKHKHHKKSSKSM